MRVEPFEPEHFASLQVQPHQSDWKLRLAEGDWGSLCAPPHRAWTALAEDGRTLACAGFVDLGGGRARVWALIGGDLGRAMTGLTRAVKQALDGAGYRRVDAEIAANFPPARRWAGMLGFQFEGVMHAYCDDGSDAELWARVK
jgi:hypothetical protein